MKKAYVKPSIVAVKIVANQAIAACVGASSAQLTGWQNDWCRTGNKTGYSSFEEAQAAHTGCNNICPVYRVEGYVNEEGREFSVSWEDWNKNGIFDAGDNVQNQQDNLGNLNDLMSNVSNGSATAVVAS